MVKPDELELFEYLGRNTKLREWLQRKLAEETMVLMNNLDVNQLFKAQARAQCWQMMLGFMDKPPAVIKR